MTTVYILDNEPVAGPETLYDVMDRIGGRLQRISRHASEPAAIRAAVDKALANSPAGTTAEIGADKITIIFADGRSIMLTIQRSERSIHIVTPNGMRMGQIDCRRPVTTYVPAPIDEWMLKERPFQALQEAALDYARHVLPAAMAAVIEDVAAGKLVVGRDDEEVQRRLGIRGRWIEDHHGDDQPEWRDHTPKAIRGDAYRAHGLCSAWLPAPEYRPAYAIRPQDKAYLARIEQLCAACQAALEAA